MNQYACCKLKLRLSVLQALQEYRTKSKAHIDKKCMVCHLAGYHHQTCHGSIVEEWMNPSSAMLRLTGSSFYRTTA